MSQKKKKGTSLKVRDARLRATRKKAFETLRVALMDETSPLEEVIRSATEASSEVLRNSKKIARVEKIRARVKKKREEQRFFGGGI